MNKKFIALIIAAVIVLCGSVFAVAKFGKANHKPQDDNAKTENSSVSSTASDNSSENASSQNVLSTDTDSTPNSSQDKTSSEASGNLPTSSTPENTDTEDDGVMTYKEYIALAPAEQQAYFETFDSIDDYFVWYNAAKKEYEDSLNAIDIDGEVNIGDLIEENNGK